MTQSFLENETLILVCMVLASIRIYLEVAGVDFSQFPMAKKLPVRAQAIHRFGLYMSLGYIILFAPEVLLS
ncbi:MAG: hypothetical protein CME65_14150 [Halobacteriovoraceae bacterium]|nr:hypothetical protein [Halobacteriovoraceae bacterium]